MNPSDLLAPILVVEDDPTDLFFLRRRLAAAGVANPIIYAEDGLAAVAMLERIPAISKATGADQPCLALVDLKMPRMDGFELLSWVQQRGLYEQMLVAVLSTSDEPRDMQRAFELGAHTFLLKYPPPNQLGDVVKCALRRVAGEDVPRSELPSANPWGFVCAEAARRSAARPQN